VFEIKPISQADFTQWLDLWQGYLSFYEAELPEEVTQTTFDRILKSEIHGAIAIDDSGKALGIVHWLTHLDTWSIEDTCYLEDLFVSSQARGQGVGRSLIRYVETWARQNNLAKVYWLTAENNLTARALYEKVADKTGFIHYEIRDK